MSHPTLSSWVFLSEENSRKMLQNLHYFLGKKEKTQIIVMKRLAIFSLLSAKRVLQQKRQYIEREPQNLHTYTTQGAGGAAPKSHFKTPLSSRSFLLLLCTEETIVDRVIHNGHQRDNKNKRPPPSFPIKSFYHKSQFQNPRKSLHMGKKRECICKKVTMVHIIIHTCKQSVILSILHSLHMLQLVCFSVKSQHS